MRDFDVLVAGGGSAGLAAAVSAARLGARTLLIERHGVLGGQAPVALVHSICGLYRLPEGDAPVFANPGFAAEFATRLLRAGGAHGPLRMGRVWVLPTQPAVFARVAGDCARETPGLEVRLLSEITAAADEEVTMVSRGRVESVRARAMIDTTGDGALAALLGAPCEQESPARLQRPAFIFALGDVDTAELGDEGRLRLARRIASAVQAATLPASALGAAFRASGQGSEVFVTIDLAAGADYEPTSAACRAELEVEGRALADVLTAFLRAEVPGFDGCAISALPARVGIRESRRIVGQYRLEAADLERGALCDDAVAVATWPMELRETNKGPRLRYPQEDRPCEIPLRALRFLGDERRFMAGRCMAASHEAQASVRVIGTCLATGEAAGFAAALQALSGHCDAASVRAARARFTT